MATLKEKNKIDPYFDITSYCVKHWNKQENKNGTYGGNNTDKPAYSTNVDEDFPQKSSHQQQFKVVMAENLQSGFNRYSERQSDCRIIFDDEHESNDDLQKSMKSNFDGKMATEIKFFECLQLLLSRLKNNAITLEMLQAAARVAGPEVNIFFERAREQSSSHKLGQHIRIDPDFDIKNYFEKRWINHATQIYTNSKEPVHSAKVDQKCQEKCPGRSKKELAEKILNGFYKYSERQSDCSIIFDGEHGSHGDLQKYVKSNFDGKMATEIKLSECLNLLLSQPKSNAITLEMLQEAATVAGPEVNIFFEKARDQSSSYELGYVICFQGDRRLFIPITTTCDSILHDKGQIFLEEQR